MSQSSKLLRVFKCKLTRNFFFDYYHWLSAALPSHSQYEIAAFSFFRFIVEAYKNRYHDEHWPLYYNLKQKRIRNRVKNAGSVVGRSIYRFLYSTILSDVPVGCQKNNNNLNYCDGLCCVYILPLLCGLAEGFSCFTCKFSLRPESSKVWTLIERISNNTWSFADSESISLESKVLSNHREPRARN